MARGRSRSSNPLVVAAAAITRSLDPLDPSRVTVLRLLADAIRLLRESIVGLESGVLDRMLFVSGAQALAASSFTCLMRLGARGGPLRRRAVVLFRLAAGAVKGTMFLSQAAVDARAHIAGLKRDSDTPRDVFDAQVASSLLVLAEASCPLLAGSDVAKDSVLFLLGPRIKSVVPRRSDVAMAAAQIMSAFTDELPPDPRVLDRALEYALASASTKAGVGGVGCALLVSACCPFLTPKSASVLNESVVVSVSRALAAAPSVAEKNVWAVALARAIVASQKLLLGACSRDRSAKLASGSQPSSRGGLSKLLYRRENSGRNIAAGMNATAPVVEGVNEVPAAVAEEERHEHSSVQLFEMSLTQIAGLCNDEAKEGALWGLASVLHMWSSACPGEVPAIVARVVEVMEPFLTSSAVLSCVLDAIVLGIWDDLQPDDVPRALSALLSVSVTEKSSRALALFLAAEVVFTFGSDAVASLCEEEGKLTFVLDVVQNALSANYSSLRSAGVALITAIAGAAPQKRAMLLTVILQNLRIADLVLATIALEGEGHLASVGAELSALLGNCAALASVVEEIAASISPEYTVPGALLEDSSEAGPSALLAQCAADAEALLTPHPVASSPYPLGRAVSYIRKRAGWALLAELANAGVGECHSRERVGRLSLLWQEELGLPRGDVSENAPADHSSSQGSSVVSRSNPGDEVGSHVPRDSEVPVESTGMQFDELKALSLSRTAALSALTAYLRTNKESEFIEVAKSLVGATAARLSVMDTGIVPINGTPSLFASEVANASRLSPERKGKVVESAAKYPQGSSSGQFSAFSESDSRQVKRGSLRSGSTKEAAANEEETRKGFRKRTLAKLCLVEAERLLDCVQLTTLTGASAELSYHIAVAYGEEAQRVMGDGAGVLASGGNVSNPSASTSQFVTFASMNGGVMANNRNGLRAKVLRARARAHGKYGFVATTGLDEMREGGDQDRVRTQISKQRNSMKSADLAWFFNTDAIETEVAERALGNASEAIASLIAGDRVISGSLLESLLSKTLTPAFCASLARALSRRLSVSDLSAMGTGRAVASLQVLLKRALAGSMALTDMSSIGSGRLPHASAHAGYAAVVSTVDDIPGSSLLSLSGELSWQAWAHSFLWELSCDDGGSRSEEARVSKLASAIRILTSDAYCELGEKGGVAMWLGLTRGVVETLRVALRGETLSQVMLAANSCTVLGSLLGSAPPALQEMDSLRESSQFTFGLSQSNSLAEVSNLAVIELCSALESEESFIRSAAACALSDTSRWTAVNSERLFANLVSAWACSEGTCALVCNRPLQMEESSLALTCLKRSWLGMSSSNRKPFFDFEPQGPGSCAGAYGMGAAAVLAACRQHWWPYKESCASAGGEIALDLIQWDASSSPRTVAAGLYCFAALWASRIDALRADGTDEAASTGSSRSSLLSSSTGHRLFRASRSPRSSVRTSAELRVPASPLFSASNAYVFPDDLNEDGDGDGAVREGNEDMSLSTFDVGEVLCPDIVQQILTCISVEGMGIHLQEVRTAGTAALAQVVRGVGPERAIDLFEELPFALVNAFDGGAAGADVLLGLCVRSNVARWFEFWILLFKSYFFGSSDEFKLAGAPPDFDRRCKHASSRTRSFVVAMTCHAFEALADLPRVDFHEFLLQNEAVAGACFSAIDLACASCISRMSTAAEEGCILLLRVLRAINSRTLCANRRDQISSALCHVLTGDCSYGVVQQAIRAATYFLCHVCFHERLFFALLGDGKPHNLHMTYKYDKYAEHVGAEAVLATLAQLSCLVSTACTAAASTDLRDAMAPHFGSLRKMFFAVVVDFGSVLSDGVTVLARQGGSLTEAGVSSAPLKQSMMRHLCFITLGAAALSPTSELESSCTRHAAIAWCNPDAPGARLVDDKLNESGCCFLETLLLSVWTWLAHQKLASHYMEAEDFRIFCDHASQTVPKLLLRDDLPEEGRMEVMASLRDLDVTFAMKSYLRISESSTTTKTSSRLVQVAFSLCMNQLTEDPYGGTIGLAFQAAGNALEKQMGTAWCGENARTVLDVFMFLMALPNSLALDEFGLEATQISIQSALIAALAASDDVSTKRFMMDVSSLLRKLLGGDMTPRLCGLAAIMCGLSAAHPQIAVVNVIAVFGEHDSVVDSLLASRLGETFALSCLQPNGIARPFLSVAAVATVYGAVVRRMTLGRGPSRQAAASILSKLHASSQSLSVQEALLSSLLPGLSKHTTSGRDGTETALRQLKNADEDAFEHCERMLRPTFPENFLVQ